MVATMPGPVERVRELALLHRAAERAVAGTGASIVVQAPAGLGKTTLLDSAEPDLALLGMQVLRARAVEHERNFAYGVVRTLFGRAVARNGPERVLTGAAAAAGALLGAAGAAPDAAAGHVYYGLYWLVANLCQDGPVAVLVDDVHEADDASLNFVSYLSRRTSDLPVLVVLTTRPATQSGSRPMLDELRAGPDMIELPPLSRAGVATVLTELLGRECGDDVAEACLRASGGNPFYLRELARDIGDQDDAELMKNVRTLAPPAIIRSILLALGCLPAGALELARACAVLGDGTSLKHAAELAGLEAGDAARAADALVAAQVLTGGAALRFAHPLLRTAVLSDIGGHQLARCHSRAARLLDEDGADAQEVAAHLLESPAEGAPGTVAVLRRAAEAATKTGSPAAAAVYLTRALAEPPRPTERGDVLFERGLAGAMLADRSALDDLAQSVSMTECADERGRRALVLAEFCRKAGQFERAVQVLTDVLSAGGMSESTEAALRSNRYWIGRTHLRTIGHVSDASECVPAYQLPDGPVRRQAAAYLAIEQCIAGTRDRACDLLTEATAGPGLLAYARPDSGSVGMTMMGLAITEQHGDFESFTTEVMEAAAESGDVVAACMTSIYRTMVMLQAGRLADVIEECETAVARAASYGWPQGSAELYAARIVALVERGCAAEAEALARSAHFALEDAEDYPTLLTLAARGVLRLAQGRFLDAAADLMTCGDRMTALRADTPAMLDWRSPAALALLASGDRDRAQALARDAVELARRLAGPIRQASALRALALATGGEEGIELLDQARMSVADTPGRLQHARILADLGAALRRSGRPAAGRPHLAAALDLAVRCGATVLAEHARAELLIAGGRPRRTSISGPDALTAAELRVVREARSGATNTEIAQRLFVSRKTVEKQLGNAYAKLGITSRRELGAIALP